MAATVSIKESKTILEGNSGIQTLSFDIVLSEAITSIVQVPYQIGIATDTATIDEDYTVTFDPIVFNPGDPLVKTLSFQIIGDRIVETDEVFTITLGTPIGATLGTQITATGTILNDDTRPNVTITAGANAKEPNTNGNFTLTRTGSTDLPLTVTLNYLGSTATVNTDYQTLPTLVTFAAGRTQAVINVTPIDDDLYEGTESIKANLVANSSYSIGAVGSAEIAIKDNETLPTLTITSASPSIIEKNSGEPANNASFQIQLSGKSATEITVNYTTVNGTAIAGSDFTSTSGQLTFAAGSTTPQTILVPITPDNIFEPDETFTLQLSNAIGASISSPFTTTILNDDVLPTITIAAGVNAQEPNTNGTFILNRTGDTTSALTVNLATPMDTATNGVDFQTIATTATFAIGSSSTIVDVKPIDDDIYEGTETIVLALQAASTYLLGAATNAEISLIDNETIPTLTITPATQTIIEKNTGDTANNASFQVQLSGKSATAITVNYSTVNGTATAGSDFTPTSGQLTFAPSTITPQTILVPITPDNIFEPDETFSIQLTNPIGAIVSSPATVSILNDDVLPIITIAVGVNAQEPTTPGTFILQRTGDLTSALTVNLITTSGSGTETIDYQAIATTAIFAPGSNSATVEVKPIDDDIYEGNERVGVLIKTGSNYSIGSSASAEISIEDNETIPTLTITPTTQAIAEKNIGDPANSASLQVQLSGKSATAITVDYSTINGTATSGSDFTATTGKLTFAPGSLSQTILVPIAPDNTFEPDETFSIQLTNPITVGASEAIGATISTTSATATIQNDDVLPTVSIVSIDNSNLPIDQLPNQQKITLKRDGDPSQPLTIKYLLTKLISGKTQDTTTTVTFTAGQSTTAIPLTIDSTIIYRELEKDTITLINDPNYAIDSLSKPTTISLTNNQTAPTISISDTEIIEGDSGTSNLRFTIRLSNPSAQTTSISYQTADGTATFSKDYTATNSTLVFAPKEIEKTIDIPIIGDKIIEKDENFILTLSNPTSGAILNKATATGLIKNNDKATVSVTVTDAQAGEPNNPGQFSINIDSATEIPIAIQYALTGKATAGTDYQALPGIVTISPGETSQLININVKDDNILEGTEVVQLKLQPSTDYQIADGKDTGIVSIADDEKALPNLITTSASIFKIENSASTGTTLKFRKLEHQAFCRNEISLFTVDDDNGTIGGIAPGQTGYQNAAIKRSRVIFAALSDSPVDLQLDGQIDRYINVETSDRIGFLMVVGSSIDEINQGTKADILFSSPSANTGSNYTRIANQGTVQQLSWEDSKTGGDGDFNDLGLEVSIQQAPNIIGTEQQGTKDLIDLRSFTGLKTFDISISGDAYYKNTVGLYKVDDLDGKIDGLKFGDTGYLAAALKRTVTSGVKGDNLAVQLDGGSILAPFLIANNSVANVLAGATAPVYFGNTLGNADKVDHIRLLGDNKFAFEDLFGGGDKDFNDVILQISARP
jgi:hypothetical protein